MARAAPPLSVTSTTGHARRPECSSESSASFTVTRELNATSGGSLAAPTVDTSTVAAALNVSPGDIGTPSVQVLFVIGVCAAVAPKPLQLVIDHSCAAADRPRDVAAAAARPRGLCAGRVAGEVGAADAGDMSQKINREAESNLRKALRLDPNNTTAYFQLSKAFGQMERVAYAEWALAEYYALLNRPEALKHAGRAVKGLPVGSPEKIRTTDILEISRATRARR